MTARIYKTAFVRSVVACTCVAALAACASNAPLALGPNVYRISERTTFGNAGAAEREAQERAREHCAKSHQRAEVTNLREQPNGRIEMTYRCL